MYLFHIIKDTIQRCIFEQGPQRPNSKTPLLYFNPEKVQLNMCCDQSVCSIFLSTIHVLSVVCTPYNVYRLQTSEFSKAA